MPWELGFADAHTKGLAAICPISSTYESTFHGQEYLGIYPYVEETEDNNKKMRLWVCENSSRYVTFDQWLAGMKPYDRALAR